MNRTEVFSVEILDELRELARNVKSVSHDGRQGWSKSQTDPMELLALFKPLHLEESMVLRASVSSRIKRPRACLRGPQVSRNP